MGKIVEFQARGERKASPLDDVLRVERAKGNKILRLIGHSKLKSDIMRRTYRAFKKNLVRKSRHLG